ncbi:MAG: oxygenase MpaB family protein [Planctomycetota bacterium]
MARSPVLERILSLDPARDHTEILYLSTRYDFPFDTVRSLELALFRTFAVPSISAILARTGEFLERAARRYDDTDLLVSELVEHGYNSERGCAAIARMNEIHGRFKIANDDFLYVLSTFVYEPIRWNERFGWRPLSGNERLAYFHFWWQVGTRMGINQIPPTFDKFSQWSLDFERARFQLTEDNRRVGDAVRTLFQSWFPKPLRGLAEQGMYALMDEPLRAAFGYPEPKRWLRAVTERAMRARRGALPWLPRRSTPFLRTTLARPGYPEGYRIGDLGPPPQSTVMTTPR